MQDIVKTTKALWGMRAISKKISIVIKRRTRYYQTMLSEFIEKQLHKARYELLGDKTYYGKIPGLRGVWSNAKNLEDCRRELQEVLEGWLLLKLRDGDSIPGLKAEIQRRQVALHA